MTINTLQQLSQLSSTKISINIYSYKTRDVHKQKSYKCYNYMVLQKFDIILWDFYVRITEGSDNGDSDNQGSTV